MRRLVSAVTLAAAVGGAVLALAQSASADPAVAAVSAPTTLNAATRRAVVDKAAKLLTEDYVFPDVGRQAAATISKKLAAGEYDGITDPGAFAKRLTEDLSAVAHDLHLRVNADGQEPPGSGGPPPRSESGFARVDILDGNIGYVDLMGFPPKDMFAPAADKAMRLVAGADALIIDLRRNGGGDPAAVAYLVSFFFDPKAPVHVNDLLWRKPGTAEYRREVFKTEPTPAHYLGKPVVLITGPLTFSGGEEFPYDLQNLKRATLVGETTGGGANPGDGESLGGRLWMFLPSGRAESPITHTNWEGRGVQPDIPVPSARAFAVAFETALKAANKPALAAGPTGPDEVVKAHLLILRTQAQPGSEAAVRRVVTELAEGKPRYDLLSPNTAKEMRAQLPQRHEEIAALGSLQSVTFIEVGPMGEDVYDVKFAKGELRWGILLDDGGKVLGEFYGPK